MENMNLTLEEVEREYRIKQNIGKISNIRVII
jgi:hypothetical protein